MKNTLLWIGRLVGLAGIVFVLIRLSQYTEQIDFDQFGISFWLVFGGLTLAYGVVNVALARAWWHLLQFAGGQGDWRLALRIYAASAIGKYVPGNIFQIAGRQALGAAAGMGNRALAKSAVLEILLLAFIGLLFGALVAPHTIAALAPAPGLLLFITILVTSLAALAFFASPLLMWAASWQAFFLIVAGLVFVVMLLELGSGPARLMLWPMMCGSFVVAWLAGFLTPGAPAGLGVRELVLVALLGSYVPEVQLLLAVILTRLVTAIGDVLFWLSAIRTRARA